MKQYFLLCVILFHYFLQVTVFQNPFLKSALKPVYTIGLRRLFARASHWTKDMARGEGGVQVGKKDKQM